MKKNLLQPIVTNNIGCFAFGLFTMWFILQGGGLLQYITIIFLVVMLGFSIVTLFKVVESWDHMKAIALSLREEFYGTKSFDTYEASFIRVDMAIPTLQLLIEKHLEWKERQ